MTEQILSQTLKLSIENKSDLTQIREVLRAYKNAGGKQASAQKVVENLRIFFDKNEVFEDITLEILDFIVGWCNPHNRIW
jgi:uncharacterized protein YacL (UPF0231 family)